MKNNKLHLLQGKSTPNITKESIRKFREEVPVLIEYFSIYAELTKAKFEALKKQGFSEQQAIELCKTL